jgi:hypothetical protein
MRSNHRHQFESSHYIRMHYRDGPEQDRIGFDRGLTGSRHTNLELD